MENIGTWLAIAAVGVGFVILIWLLFAGPSDTKKKK